MNILPSLVRTYVPIVVGYIIGWVSTLGVHVDPDRKAALVAVVGAAASAAYYLLARLLERKVPSLTWLLGSSLQPVEYKYAAQTTPPPVTAPIAPAVPDMKES